ncbi:beta strand repeat-containing protein [Humibacter ginsenosidimutans]|uniref:Ig-like domain-containing protein n=1 Tax=Humibacter ginsenosidimutans TaxID=2599293 RepID=A0A5B8M785_9MICO|nr:immunoglobulin domain-containing protein [Humibacter ginsenosidimutans]QDZ15310.1 hypothetical protein FPZ11_11545 [Humibacter ginsenosidimutans]
MGGAVTVEVPAGTYALSHGTLNVGTQSGADITVQGSGAVIDGGGTTQIMTLDPSLAGGVAVTVDGIGFENGAANDPALGGGGAIIGGSGGLAADDSLTVHDSTFDNNVANTGTPNTTVIGGAIFFGGGSLSISDSSFTANSANGSSGGAVAFVAAAGGPQNLTVSGSTFSGNTTGAATTDAAALGGGALYVTGRGASPAATVTASTFTDNVSKGSAVGGRGGAIRVDVGSASVTASTFTGNQVAGSNAEGAAVSVESSASLQAHDDRITGNSGSAAVTSAAGSGSITDNWWGCNGGPGAAGCDTQSGFSTASPSLQLRVTANPSVVAAPATTSVLTADLLSDSGATAIPAASLGAFEGLPVTWAVTSGGGSVSPSSSNLASGAAGTTFTVPASGSAQITATFDNAHVPVTVGQAKPPEFTSAASTSVASGGTLAFPVTVSGTPTPTVSISGAPSWVSLSGGSLVGSVPSGATGPYTFTLSAANGVSPDASQPFTLTVTAVPVVTQNPSDVNTALAGTTVTFTAAATGYPTPTVQWQRSTDHGGTYTAISGANDTTLSLPVTLADDGTLVRAVFTNSTGSATTTAATLHVGAAPVFTSGDAATFTVGQPGSFAVAASGSPAPTISVGSGAPAWLTLNASDELVGTPPAGSGGVYLFTLTASNGFGTPATQPFTLTVNEAPVVTLQPANAAVNPGTAVTFTAGASGFPAPSVQWQVSTDGATFTDVSGATSDSYTLTPGLSDDGNEYRAIFTNAAGTATTSAATLAVGTAPTFTSANAATFTVGDGAQTFAVTVDGHPAPTLSVTGQPSWLSLSGSTLSGEPPAGSGGTYGFVLHATNSFGADVTQNFTLTVDESPAFSSPDTATATVGTAFALPVTTSGGYPVPTGLKVDGALPDGVTFTSGPSGSGLFSGTPAAGTGGVYPVTITTIGGDVDVAQNFTLTVDEAPAITSAAAVTFTRGVTQTVTITTAHAYPVPTLASSGTLPTGLTFVDNGDGTATLQGSTTDAAGTFDVTIRASNGVGADAVQSLDITVANAAAVPLPLLPPLTAGHLNGVPAHVTPLQVITVSGDGFAPFAPVTLGFYSTPQSLGTATADASGAFTASITIPAGTSGTHTIVAAGIDASGADAFLSAQTIVTPASSGSGSGTGSSSGATGNGVSGSTVADTGLPEDAVGTGILAAIVVLLGAAVLAARGVRRRASQK